MADWKRYINSGFTGCLLLAYARDHVRIRDVRIWKIPGEVDDVGISDGTDAWIAPVSADCFSVNVKRLLDDLAAGKPLAKPVPLVANGRRRLIEEDAPPAPWVHVADALPKAPEGRRRLLIEEPAATLSTNKKARRARLDV